MDAGLNHGADKAVSSSGSKALTWFLGAIVITLAGAVLSTSAGIGEIMNWVHQAFGVTFLVLFSGLVLVTLYCWLRLQRRGLAAEGRKVWLEAGMHAANGVATLGLTYTLLGISLGISSLSESQLTPETVQEIIGQLTRHFSMAFLTSVVGVPVAAVLRAMVMVSETRIVARAQQTPGGLS
jgi:hypothetical protein